MRIFVDIDNTICHTKKVNDNWDYKNSIPIQLHIDKINNLYDQGNEIVYWTARGSSSNVDWLDFTADQLDQWGCLYNELICGKDKGSFDMLIDDKAIKIEELQNIKKIGFTCSTFDLLHPGHIQMLKDCKTVCDYLIIGLQVDPTVDRTNKNKPIQSLKERKIMIESIKYVDEVITYKTEHDLEILLQKINPDIRIIGSDWKNKKITASNLNIPIYWHNRNHNWSTTNLRKRIAKEQ